MSTATPEALRSALNAKTVIDPGVSSAPGLQNYVPPVEPEPPKPEPLPPDLAQEMLEKFEENARSLDALRNAQRQWEREVAAITEAPDGADEEQLDRLARLEDELKRAPGKIRLLERRANSIRRELQKEFGIRYYKLQQLAHTIFQERRDRAVQFLLPKCERDQEAAYLAALELPSVKRAAEVVDSFQYVCATDPVLGCRQLIGIDGMQRQLTAEARKLVK